MATVMHKRGGVPLELLKYIVDFLRDDIDALRTCALICKDWVPISRYYVGLVVDDWLRDFKRTYDALISLLDRSDASIGSFWRHLRIQSEQVQAAELVTLLSKLPSLQSLAVRLNKWGEPWKDAGKEFSRFTGITELSLDGEVVENPDEIVALACALPSLEKLEFRGFILSETVVFPRTHVPSRILRTLHIRYCIFKPILSWMMSLDQMPPLHTVLLTPASSTDFETITALLRTLGESLKHLEIHFLSARSIESLISQGIDLGENHNLRCLTINYQLRTRDHDELRDGGHLPAIIGQIVSWRMEQIKICSEIENVDADVWAEVDQLLNRPQFTGLRRLIIRLRSHRMRELVKSIRGWLPISSAREILEFV